MKTSDIQEVLMQSIADARVVVFCSNITDVRAVITRLNELEITYREMRLGMASGLMREQFHLLQEMTGWPYLPQIFIDGVFIGGADEFFDHPLIKEESAHL